MTTLYQQRATIATPTDHLTDANQLALFLGESTQDDRTFTSASYQDADGNLYAVCSTVTKPVFAQLAGQPLQAPDHAPDMDLAAATRAQGMLQINGGAVSPDVIAVILGNRLESAQDHIAALGLISIPQTDQGVY